jgi:hypothetical protein
MIDHPIICKIHGSRLTTHVRNEVNCRCSCTKILAFLSMKLELLCPLLFVSPFSRPKDFFFFPLSIVQTWRGKLKWKPKNETYNKIHDALHRTKFRGTIEPKLCGKSTSKEHNYYYISRRFKRRNWSFHRFPEFLLSRLFFCFMSFKPSRK